MERKKIFDEVETLLISYCQGCFLHKHHKEEKGRRYAHKYCINECTVGNKIKSIGNKLSNFKK